jgi:hypothetical protein
MDLLIALFTDNVNASASRFIELFSDKHPQIYRRATQFQNKNAVFSTLLAIFLGGSKKSAENRKFIYLKNGLKKTSRKINMMKKVI